LQPNAENRAQSRSNVFLTASLVGGSFVGAVRVRNLSPAGALVDGASFPPIGADILLLRGELKAEGTVAWQAGSLAGIRFAGPIDVAEWVKKSGHPGQQRVDTAVAALRRHEAGMPLDGDGEPPSLGAISAELDQICERLAGASGLSNEVGEELVRLDGLARTLQRLADGSV
jgi:hypothetical protein